MDTQWGLLSRLLEDEVARQEALLDLCQAQYRAIRANDIEYIEAKAADIQAANREGDEAAYLRQHLAETIADHYRIPREGVSIAALADRAPRPYQDRLRAADARIEAIQHELRHLALASVESLQRTATAIVQSIDAFKGCVQLVPDAGLPQPGHLSRAESRAVAS